MKHIKVLGTGCANCKATLKLIDDIAKAKGVVVQLEKVENIADIMAHGIMSTPGVAIVARWCTPATCPTAGKSKAGSGADGHDGKTDA